MSFGPLRAGRVSTPGRAFKAVGGLALADVLRRSMRFENRRLGSLVDPASTSQLWGSQFAAAKARRA